MEKSSSPNIYDVSTNNFNDRLISILDSEVTPESIDTVADKALNDLVVLVDDVLSAYNQQPIIFNQNKLHHEVSAFSYFNLNDIGVVLDDIQKKVILLQNIDKLIYQDIYTEDLTYIPPQITNTTIQQGSGNFEPKKLIPKLKTLIYILNTELEVPIQDVTISKGTNSAEMMRKESYVLVEVPKINRAFLVCDEEGNATYIFDTKVLNDFNILPRELVELDKADLADFIKEQPAIGFKLIYSKNWAGNMLNLLKNILNSDTASNVQATDAPKILIGQKYQKAPDGVLSISGMANKWESVTHKTISKAIDTLGDNLGTVGEYMFGVQTTYGYTKEQQDLIYAELEAMGIFADKAPDGVLSIRVMARKWGVSNNTVTKAIDTLGDNLGTVGEYMFLNRTTHGYTKKQQDLIYAELEAMGIFADNAPDGVLSIEGMRIKWGVGHNTVSRAIDALGDNLGEISKYVFKGNKITNGYTKEQQDLIYAELEAMGIFADKAPDGVLSIKNMADKWSVNEKTILKVVYTLENQLGIVCQYRYGVNTTNGYTKEQQDLIYAELEAMGIFADKAPDGVLNIKNMATKWGVGQNTIKKAIDALGDNLGDVSKYIYGSVITSGYTEEQQKILLNRLLEKGFKIQK